MGKWFQINDLYGVIGASLFLVLVYLALTNWVGLTQALSTTFTGANTTFKTLQGR